VRRRGFLALAGADATAAAGSAVLPGGEVSASPLGLPFGYQAWELAPDMKKDWDGTLKAMKHYGYSYAVSTVQGPPLAPPDYSVLEVYKRSADFLKAFSEV
jgi:hypothetical protein